MSKLRVVAISDTHMRHKVLSEELRSGGDVLVHSGDFSGHGTIRELHEFVAWFADQPFKTKILVAGNHDGQLASPADRAAVEGEIVSKGIVLLEDSSHVEHVDGKEISFYGAPWTPTFGRWHFMLERGDPIKARWKQIPEWVDVLITHGPPYGHGDNAPGARQVGCIDLLLRVQAVRPQVHVFGHIHEGYGVTYSDAIEGTAFVNASICDGAYRPTRQPTRFSVKPRRKA